MSTPFEDIAGLDKLIHEPARLAILTALSSVENADFLFLQNLIGLTKGNLSTHLTKLEEGELVKITKKFQGKKPITLVELTPQGREATRKYWSHMEALRKQAANWRDQKA